TSRSCRPSRARATGRCWRRGSACSNGTAPCSTPRPRWRTRAGRAWARPTSTPPAGWGTGRWAGGARTRPSAGPWRASTGMARGGLGNATELLLERRRRVRPADAARIPRRRGSGGSATRAAAGALRIGNAIGSALTSRHVTGPAERRLLVGGGSLLVLVTVIALLWPRLVAWPLGALSLWLAVALLLRAARMRLPRVP